MAATAVDVDHAIYVTGISFTAAEEDIRQLISDFLRAAGFDVHSIPDPEIARGGIGSPIDAVKIAWSLISMGWKVYFWIRKALEERAKAWRQATRPLYQVKIRMVESYRPAKELIVVLPDLVEVLRREYPMFTYHFEVDGLERTWDHCYLWLPEQALSNKNLRDTYRLLDGRQGELTCIYWQIKQGLFGGWKSRMRWGETMAALDVVKSPLQHGSHGHWAILRQTMPGRWR